MTERERVAFERPPVVEVVFGVQFATEQLQGPHVGLFWQYVRNDFPRFQEVAPLPAVIEGAPGTPEKVVDVALPLVPPLRRTWLLSEDGSSLIQIQEDRFLVNWKRMPIEGDRPQYDIEYPSYDTIVVLFESYWGKYNEFLQSEGIELVDVQQQELTYINHISEENGLSDIGRGHIFVDHLEAKEEGRFLPAPEAINWRTSYVLPDNCGRLHMTVQSAIRRQDSAPIVRFDVTARGVGSDGLRSWFDLAHEWITHGFADVTSPELHQVWGRTS